MIEPQTEDTPYAEFGAGLFHHILDEHHGAFLSLNELIADREAITTYLENRKQELLRKYTDLDEKFQQIITSTVQYSRLADIQTAKEIINRQAIVVTVTFIESMLQEFFQCTFCRYPLLMNDFLPTTATDSAKGKIDLKELIQAESKSNLIYSLASRAAAAAMQGKFQTTIKNLQKVTKNSFEADLLDGVRKINERRNKIVHELSEDKISIEEVETTFEVVFKLVQHLKQAAIQLNIPVMRISVDDEGVRKEAPTQE